MTPPLAHAALWTALKEGGSERARTRLIELHWHYVLITRERCFPSLPQGIEADDLEGEGLLGLVRAVDRFEPGRGVKFSTFLVRTVRGAMLEYLRRESWAPRSVWRQVRQGELDGPLALVSLEQTYTAEGGERLAERIADPAPGPEARALTGQEETAVAALLAALPAREEEVLRDLYWDGMTLIDSGKRRGISQSRAGQLKLVGLGRLQGWLCQERG